MKINKVENWDLWDEFVKNIKSSSFLSLSFWLETYCFLPLLVKKVGYYVEENLEIVGGISGLKLGFWKFSIYIFPAGPIFRNSISEKEYNLFLDLILKKYILNHFLFIQFASKSKFSDFRFENRKFIKFVYLDSGLNLIKLKENMWDQLNSFKPKVRRDINSSLRKNLVLEFAQTEEDLIKIYDIFKLNSIDSGYKIKNYFFYKKSWLISMKKHHSLFLCASSRGELKGAIWLIDCGYQLNYVMGGTLKEKPDLNVGYFLQWHAIQISINKGYSTYNISVGGSDGVRKFKSDFGAEIINNINYYGYKRNFLV